MEVCHCTGWTKWALMCYQSIRSVYYLTQHYAGRKILEEIQNNIDGEEAGIHFSSFVYERIRATVGPMLSRIQRNSEMNNEASK